MEEIEFEEIPSVDDISGVIEDVFGVKLDIEGDWGYDNKRAVIVKSLDVPPEQFLYMFASIRANVQMNLTLEKEDRYGGINVALEELKQIDIQNQTFDVATFKITAMKEEDYAFFIKEYKENYGKADFDLDKHFKQRADKTITVYNDFWFLGLPNV